MDNIKSTRKKSIFWVKITAITIIIISAITGIVFGGIHINTNSKLGSPFSGELQANVKFNKKNSKINIDDSTKILESKMNPLKQKEIAINKIGKDLLNVSVSANMYESDSDFLREVERSGSIFFLDKDGKDLLVGNGEGKQYKPSETDDAKRIALNKLIEEENIKATVSSDNLPTVKLKLKNSELFQAISEYLQKKNQNLWIWTDIGIMLDEIRNNFDDVRDFKKVINNQARKLRTEKNDDAAKKLEEAAKNLLKAKATSKSTKKSIQISLYEITNINDIYSYYHDYELKFNIKNYNPSGDEDLTIDINDPDYNYTKNQVINPFRPILQNIIKEVGKKNKYSRYLINGNLKDEEVINSGIKPDSTDANSFHIPINGLEQSQVLAKIIKVGIQGIIFTIDTYGKIDAPISNKTFNIAILIFSIFLSFLAIYLIVAYRLAGTIILLMISTAMVVGIVIFNLLNPLYGIEIIIAIFTGLTIALASNIILMERMKEEFKLGKPTLKAFKDANRKSLSSVFDINLLSLITALILFWFGINMIKSFAIMLIMLIISTTIIAILLTRITLALIIKTNLFEQKTILFGDNQNIIKNDIKISKNSKNFFNKINFIKISKWFMIFGALIIGIGGIVALTAGPKNSLDFQSGTAYKIDYGSYSEQEENTNFNTIKDNIEKYMQENLSKTPYYLSKFTDPNEYKFFLLLRIGATTNQQRVDLKEHISQITNPQVNSVDMKDFEPTILRELIINGLIALAIIIGILLVYIFIRFNWAISLSIIIGIITNVLILSSLIIIMRLELTLALIIVLIGLIILGIMLKTIFFDRITEMMIEYKEQDLNKNQINKLINIGIKLSFKQSILTLLMMSFLAISFIGFGITNLIVLFIIGFIFIYLATIFINSWVFALFANIRHKYKQKKLQKIYQPIEKDEIDEQLVPGINS